MDTPAPAADDICWRLFVALPIPAAVRAAVVNVQQELAAQRLGRGRFTAPEHLHLTLKFMGEQPARDVPAFTAALAAIRWTPFHATVGDAGTFARARGPCIVWLHLAGDGVLDLHRQVDAALRPWLPAETRFMSHLTIARLAHVPAPLRLASAFSALRVATPPFTVDAFTLQRSVLHPTGPVYTTLATFPAA